MTGWTADFLRFWWALFYWNTRKTWFRLTGARRDSCPCQSYSDSGRALDSRCEAVVPWRNPRRFTRVCPLLTEAKNGWLCGVDAERVRPFWGRALLYAGSAVLALYLAGTVAVYSVLRATGYEVHYLGIAWPPSWVDFRSLQERLHASRAQRALAEGNFPAAILSLQTVCELNPRNFEAGITLAKLAQLSGHVSLADHIHSRLMRDVPEQRPATALNWIRSLLARGDYAQVKTLAASMLGEDAARRGAWLHALFFAARQTRDQDILRPLLGTPSLPDWCLDLIGIEQLMLENRPDQAIPRLLRIQASADVPYVPYYQADRLLHLGYNQQATRLINAYGNRLPTDEASFLRLRAFHALKWTSLIESEYEILLGYPMTPRLAALFCASLLEQPAPGQLGQYLDRFQQHGPPLDNDTLPVYHATYLVAMHGGEAGRAEKIAASIHGFTAANAKALRDLGELLRSHAPLPKIATLLPLVPLPIEVIYAIHARPTGPVAP